MNRTRRNTWPRAAARARGFTLLELLVVLALASLVVGVVAPAIPAAFPGVELRKAARELHAALTAARSRAVTQGRTVALRLDVQEKRYWIVEDAPRIVVDRNGAGAALSSRPAARDSGRLPRDLEMTLHGADSEIVGDEVGGIRFFPDGSSTGGRITVALGDRAYTLEVDWLLGRVVLEG